MPSNAKTRARTEGGKFATLHGAINTKTYGIWADMLKRCRHHPRYAGRGIKVCKRWEDFDGFLADMGECPAGMSLDRFPDNDGDYEPTNCRWATDKQQANNRRSNRIVEHDGQRKSLTEWCDEFGISPKVVRDRLETGWPTKEALTLPVGSRFRPPMSRKGIGGLRGEKNPSAKITQKMAEIIRQDKRTSKLVAVDHGVSSSLVRKIKRGIVWAN